MKETDAIDRLYLELSQFTSAITNRELKLADLLYKVLSTWKGYDIISTDMPLFEEAFALMQSVYKHDRAINDGK